MADTSLNLAVKTKPRQGGIPDGVVSLCAARAAKAAGGNQVDFDKHQVAETFWNNFLDVAERQVISAVADAFRSMRYVRHD